MFYGCKNKIISKSNTDTKVKGTYSLLSWARTVVTSFYSGNIIPYFLKTASTFESKISMTSGVTSGSKAARIPDRKLNRTAFHLS